MPKSLGVEDPNANNAFRNVKVSGSQGKYIVTGEARVFEATMNYGVSDGHNYLLEKMYTLDEGAPAWSAFRRSRSTFRKNSGLLKARFTVELFEYSAKNGSVVNLISLPLERFGS